MYFITVTNLKKKLLTTVSITLLWTFLIIGTIKMPEYIIKYSVLINNDISFSYPSEVNISDIYSKNRESSPFIQSSKNDYKSFIDIKSIENGIEFSYPSIFKADKQNFPGSEILYHISLQNKHDKSKNGFVQVWNLPYSLEKFLEQSKQSALMDITDFSSKKININNLNGYFWEYTIRKAPENYKSLEVFLIKDSKLYRVSYFLPQNKYNTDEYNMFWDIVKSLKVT
jgi:hypothetical protein